ncbi:hypothetical protein KFL_000110200 [Klebsormidium nitens]|uniref:Uncharacterized protein n=1 Tax=Klebsormidium nitens TaxID=105231 RepID=A0A1Y1HK69_KLENI|nr:hypothetical protein KFL_000110200 [Klebsormidium nitens]|eukprot:GAQ78323.1 hypothetical protein KFL_000110200 [Klebsormidium nitens]
MEGCQKATEAGVSDVRDMIRYWSGSGRTRIPERLQATEESEPRATPILRGAKSVRQEMDEERGLLGFPRKPEGNGGKLKTQRCEGTSESINPKTRKEVSRRMAGGELPGVGMKQRKRRMEIGVEKAANNEDVAERSVPVAVKAAKLQRTEAAGNGAKTAERSVPFAGKITKRTEQTLGRLAGRNGVGRNEVGRNKPRQNQSGHKGLDEPSVDGTSLDGNNPDGTAFGGSSLDETKLDGTNLGESSQETTALDARLDRTSSTMANAIGTIWAEPAWTEAARPEEGVWNGNVCGRSGPESGGTSSSQKLKLEGGAEERAVSARKAERRSAAKAEASAIAADLPESEQL